jgi:rhodanese-related sulfurtransferase
MSLLSELINKCRKASTSTADINTIDAMELNRRLSSPDLVVIDVRNPDEFSSPLGHIENAINLPLPSLAARLHELSAYRKRKIVVVCLSDKRSTQAIQSLRGAGFEDLILLRGGMKEWAANHLPVTIG